MYTVDTALESLKKYDIYEADLLTWEKELNLEIPVDEYGRKQYSPHHVNLFKNIKKHIALGRTIAEIKRIISLPPIEASKPQVAPGHAAGKGVSKPAQPQEPSSASASGRLPKSPYATQPQASIPATPPSPQARRGAQPAPGSGAANVVHMMQRLSQEKDQLYAKLLETEKLNSHLYSANTLFHKKVRDMAKQMQSLRENLNENEKFKLLDDKARLHKQLIEVERLNQYKEESIASQRAQNDALKQQITQLEERIQAMAAPFDLSKFQGDWMENGQLVDVLYDNFGINIEGERMRLFRISEAPTRVYGPTAIINTSYQYESNNLWKREETLVVSYLDEQTLSGELIAEYVLDGVPVAKALYRVTCTRSR